MGLLLATLVALGWGLVRQDEQLEAHRLRDVAEGQATVAVAALEKRLSAIDAELARLLGLRLLSR